MKRKIYVIAAAVAALATACTSQKGSADAPAEWETETINVADSTDYAHVSASIQLPLASDSAMTAMRNTLISIAVNDLRGNYNDQEDFISQKKMGYKPFEGDTTDAQAVLTYNVKQLTALYDAMSKSTMEEYKKMMEEQQNDSLAATDESDSEMKPEHWTYEEKCTLEDTTATYAAFNFSGFIYNSSAAHPYSSCGAGDITLRRSDGKWIRKFFVDGAEEKMQPLLVAGMVHYFHDDCEQKEVNAKNVFDQLLSDDHGNTVKRIPLPTIWIPFPKDNGICLVYAQYEIAPYAAGMPAFVIPYKDVMPYLTEEAAALLSK